MIRISCLLALGPKLYPSEHLRVVLGVALGPLVPVLNQPFQTGWLSIAKSDPRAPSNLHPQCMRHNILTDDHSALLPPSDLPP